MCHSVEFRPLLLRYSYDEFEVPEGILALLMALQPLTRPPFVVKGLEGAPTPTLTRC